MSIIATPDNLYSHFGKLMLGTADGELRWLHDTTGNTCLMNSDTALVAEKGSPIWCEHMLKFHTSVLLDLKNEREALKASRKFQEDLGQALLEKAIEKDWCEEYDDFAEEWDLPQRRSEFDVTVTVRIMARDSEQAAELIRGELGFNSYHDDVIEGPEVTAEMAY